LGETRSCEAILGRISVMKIEIEYDTQEECVSKLSQLLQEKKKITGPSDIAKWCSFFSTAKKEYFVVLLLDGAHNIIQSEVVSIGTLNRTIVHPREVFLPAVQHSAGAVILVHNHPSGSLEPSREDLEITERLVKAGEVIGINVLDHLIVHDTLHRSMLEKGDCNFQQ
jgi:DNA repair protein RadC